MAFSNTFIFKSVFNRGEIRAIATRGKIFDLSSGDVTILFRHKLIFYLIILNLKNIKIPMDYNIIEYIFNNRRNPIQ